MRHTSKRRRAASTTYVPAGRGGARMAAQPARVPPDPANGLHTCPVCGGGVPLLPWKSAQAVVWAASKAERVDRLRAHAWGGDLTRSGGRAGYQKCAGTYAIPID